MCTGVVAGGGVLAQKKFYQLCQANEKEADQRAITITSEPEGLSKLFELWIEKHRNETQADIQNYTAELALLVNEIADIKDRFPKTAEYITRVLEGYSVERYAQDQLARIEDFISNGGGMTHPSLRERLELAKAALLKRA